MIAPVVKFMHGYFGTCIGGQKMHGFPAPHRVRPSTFGLCLRGAVPSAALRTARAIRDACQRVAMGREAAVAIRSGTRTIVVASEHMRREFERNGCAAVAVAVNPLFPTITSDVQAVRRFRSSRRDVSRPDDDAQGRRPADPGRRHRAAHGSAGVSDLIMIGDGPQRAEWEELARRLNVAACFTGVGERRQTDGRLLACASVVALPSTWPEPFGLVGLEAGALGVPTVAFDRRHRSVVAARGEWSRRAGARRRARRSDRHSPACSATRVS